MVRVLTSFGLGLLALGASAQPFGRFAYSQLPKAAGFIVSNNGFQASTPGADTFQFERPAGLTRTQCSFEQAWYRCTEFAGNPKIVHVNVRAPGFEMYCPFGLRLRLKSLGAPILTVKDSSFGAGTPASASPWVLVTFSDAQPPVLFSFMSAPKELIVDGASGQWTLRTIGLYSGWVRVSLPFGSAGLPVNDVAAMGSLAGKVEKSLGWLSQPAPKLVEQLDEADDDSVTVTWRFDRPSALVPPSLVLAKSAGYGLKTLTEVVDTGYATEEGPVVLCKGTELKVRFPLARVPVGRAVTMGAAEFRPAAEPWSLGSTVEAALANFWGTRSQDTLAASNRSLDEFFRSARPAAESPSGVKLLFGEGGQNIDSAAANALLAQCVGLSKGRQKPNNSLLTSLVWLLDPMTLRLSASDRAASRRASGLLAAAAAVDPDPSIRAQGALLQAGLSSANFLAVFCQKRGVRTVEEPAFEPLKDLRSELFSLQGSTAPKLLPALSSDLRVTSEQAVVATATKGGWILSWPWRTGDPKTVSLVCSVPLKISARTNLKAATVSETFGSWAVRFEPKAAGQCQILVTQPGWGPKLPPSVPVPRYSE